MRKHLALVLAFVLLLTGTPAGAQEMAVGSELRPAMPDRQAPPNRYTPAKSMLLQALEATMQQERNGARSTSRFSATTSRPVSSIFGRTTTGTRPASPLERPVLAPHDPPAPMVQRRRTRPRPTQDVSTTSCSQAIVNRAESDAEDRGVGAYIGGGFLLPVVMPLIADSAGPERPTARLLQVIGTADQTCYSDYYAERVKARKVNAAWRGTWIGFGLWAGLIVLAYATGPSYY